MLATLLALSLGCEVLVPLLTLQIAIPVAMPSKLSLVVYSLAVTVHNGIAIPLDLDIGSLDVVQS
jgi:hypothetical protein